MQTKKIPGPSAKGEPGKRKKEKFYRPHLNKFKPNIPPQYYRKFDREILEGFAEKFRGSLVGQVAAQRLRKIRDLRGGTA